VSATAPLQGLKVVELARILAGPSAGQVLADLGATVIKVESPAGDDTRKWGPPFITNSDGTRDAAYFHDSMVGVLANQALNYLSTGTSPQRMGNAHPNIVPYQVLPAADGWFILAVGNDSQFARFCELVRLDGLAQDSRFATNAERVANRLPLTQLIEAATAKWPRDEILLALEAAGVPAGPINTVGQALNDPQIRSRAMVVELQRRPGETPVQAVRTPIRFSASDLSLSAPSPVLGNGNATHEPQTLRD
jgi:crotonobetainyl-CoA:carnitine CoA-transferase CaiB-like acyl-CoA transferase